MNLIRSGQVSWLAKGDLIGQVHFYGAGLRVRRMLNDLRQSKIALRQVESAAAGKQTRSSGAAVAAAGVIAGIRQTTGQEKQECLPQE